MPIRAEKIIFLSFASFLSQGTVAQKLKADSLKQALSVSINDSSKAEKLNDLAWELSGGNPDTAILLSKQALAITERIKWDWGIARSYHNLGWFYSLKGDNMLSLDNSHKALVFWESAARATLDPEIATRRSNTLTNIGVVYHNLGNYPRALQAYFDALKGAETKDDKQLQATALGNIGLVYADLSDYPRAKEYYAKALKLAELIDDKKGVARHLGNMGGVYYMEENYPQALDYYSRSLKMKEALGNKLGAAVMLGNIGLVYDYQYNYKKALAYYFRALALSQEVGDLNGVARHTCNIGSRYSLMGNFAEGEKFLKESLRISKEINSLELIRMNHKYLSIHYDTLGNAKMALEHYKKYIAVGDSINNEENTKRQVQLEMQYEFDKKEAAAQVEQEKKDAVAMAEKRRQRIILFSVSSLGLLVLGFAVFAYRSFLHKKKANIEISAQKHIIEEKQKEILDSIYYARRIQRSLLPQERYIQRQLTKKRNTAA